LNLIVLYLHPSVAKPPRNFPLEKFQTQNPEFFPLKSQTTIEPTKFHFRLWT
jgi:hypothetical protein